MHDASHIWTLDVSGQKCPMPIIKLQQCLRQLKQDNQQHITQVNVITTDPSAPQDLESWCRVNKYVFLACQAQDNGHICSVGIDIAGDP